MQTQKKQMQMMLAVVTVVASTFLLAACGKAGFSSDTSNGGGGIIQTCTAAGCTYPLSANSGAGFYAQTSNFIIPNYINNGSVLAPQAGMASIQENMMGACNRQSSIGGYSGGLAACSAWTADDMVLYTNTNGGSSNLKLILRSVPGVDINAYGYSWYSYSLPNFQQALLGLFGVQETDYAGVFDPLVLNATIWPINNSQGFEVRATGPTGSYGWKDTLQLQVPNGSLQAGGWAFNLYIRPSSSLKAFGDGNESGLAASGQAIACQSMDCGLDGSYFNAGN